MLNLDTENNRGARMLEQGRVSVTFKSPTGSHITILAKCRTITESGKWVQSPIAEAKVIFLEVPNSDGWNDKVGKFTRSKGFVADSSADEARIFCAKQLLAYVQGQPTNPNLEILEEDTCGRCGRQLTDPVSIQRGIGPECYGKITGSQHQTKNEYYDGGSGLPLRVPTTPAAEAPAPTPKRSSGSGSGSSSSSSPTTSGGYDWRSKKKLDQQKVEAQGHGKGKAKLEITGCNRDDLYPDGIPY